MKSYKKILIILMGLFIILPFTCCEEEVLDKAPRESFSEKDIWNDIDLVKKYVWNNYNALGDFGITMSHGYMEMYETASDVAWTNKTSVKIWNRGSVTPDRMGKWGPKWEDKYDYIRNINVFFDKIDEVETQDEDIKTRLKGEMKFLRAWCYFELINTYGGVPLITEPYSLDEDFTKEKRNSYQECVNFLVKELDEAKDMLPETVPSEEWGRITKGAALALKAEALLYAASKLYDPSTEPSGPLYDYDKQNKWQDASDAAEAVMDLNQYSLVEVDDWKDYQDMFLHNTSEIILARPYHKQYGQWAVNINKLNVPNGYGGWGYHNTPNHLFVQDFQMKDGKSIEDSPLYGASPDSIYKNRELRFYADIVYQGAEYYGRPIEYYLPGGLDSKDGPEYWNYSRTRYSMRKHIDESVDFHTENPETPYIIFRLAEIYLNYAEAQYQLGNEGVAREYVNKIRTRAHLPDINSSGEELLEDIRHERKIELCYERKRFFDIRRWMIGEEALNKPMIGIKWMKVDEEGELDPEGELTYELITVQERNFRKRLYHLPIPREEINKSNLEQNWGYD